MRILVTGGAGYIGSHTLLELLGVQHDICVLDNYSNSSPEALSRVRLLTNTNFLEIKADIRDDDALAKTFQDFQPEAVIHFAGLKAVGESGKVPLTYYENNIHGSLSLLKAMEAVNCRRIVFSSSATVYGEPQYLPYDEAHSCAPTNPYGRTKYFVEEILKDWATSNSKNSAVLLRYFNPVGAHSSGSIGEDPNGIPNNLMPFVSQVAVGQRDQLNVFGGDYDTRDGTGLRDYIHVSDLASAHVAAVNYSAAHTGVEAFNIGTGKGATVLEVVKAFEEASAQDIPYVISPRRLGDIAASVADPKKAHELLGWKAKLTLKDMCQSTWKWQSQNPEGYR